MTSFLWRIAGVTPAPGAVLTTNLDGPMMDQNGAILYRAQISGGGSTTLDNRAYFLGRANGDMQMWMIENKDMPRMMEPF